MILCLKNVDTIFQGEKSKFSGWWVFYCIQKNDFIEKIWLSNLMHVYILVQFSLLYTLCALNGAKKILLVHVNTFEAHFQEIYEKWICKLD